MTRLEELLSNGTLHTVAARSETLSQFCASLGMQRKAYESAVRRLRLAGRAIPSFSELQRQYDNTQSGAEKARAAEFEHTQIGSTNTQTGEFEEEEATQPGVPLSVIGEGFHVRGKSTLIRDDGSIAAQWIKVSAQHDERKDWLDAIRALVEEMPRFAPVAAPQFSDDDLLTVLPVGDPHIGLLAWHEDAGENFDMDIAERNLVAAFEQLVSLAPASTTALLIYVGDNAHADSQSNTTTKGTRVDADGRTVKMARRIVRTIRRNIDTVLTKHARAHVIIERGNHDELISAMIALALSLLYENEPRVFIDQSPEMYHWFRFGQCLVGTHHGDKAKPMDLLGVMAVDRQKDWGETKHRRFYTGHLHHLVTKEVPGVIIETLPTLASSDAWHRAMGYRSQRAMYMDVLHREHGHINRHFVGIDRLRAA